MANYLTRIEAFFPADNSHRTFITDITDTVEELGGTMTTGIEEDLLVSAEYHLTSKHPGVEILGSCVDVEVGGKIFDWRNI